MCFKSVEFHLPSLSGSGIFGQSAGYNTVSISSLSVTAFIYGIKLLMYSRSSFSKIKKISFSSNLPSLPLDLLIG